MSRPDRHNNFNRIHFRVQICIVPTIQNLETWLILASKYIEFHFKEFIHFDIYMSVAYYFSFQITLLIVALMSVAVTVATKAKVYYGYGGYGGYYGGHYGKGYGYGHGYGGKIRMEILHIIFNHLQTNDCYCYILQFQHMVTPKDTYPPITTNMATAIIKYAADPAADHQLMTTEIIQPF